jgi:RNA polymerase sigma factor (sigma-70 family)
LRQLQSFERDTNHTSNRFPFNASLDVRYHTQLREPFDAAVRVRFNSGMPLPDFVRLFRSRNDRAREFDALLREHIPALYRAAYRWTGAVDQAEDLVQELLTRLYPRLDELRGLEQIKPWALRVMYRLFVDQLRRQRNSPVQFGMDPTEDDDTDGRWVDELEPEILVDRELSQARIVAAWSELSEDHRVVLSMHDIEEYSLVEIAAMTDTPIGTLKSRIHRARARLRDLLSREPSDSSVRVASRDNGKPT